MAMKKCGISRRRRGWTDGTPSAPVSREQLKELYVAQGLSLGDTAAWTPGKYLSARRSAASGLRRAANAAARYSRRPSDTDRLHDLHVVQRLDAEAIGQLVGVLPLRVRLRRGELGVKRPRLGAPRPALSITPAQLRALYVDQGRTLV